MKRAFRKELFIACALLVALSAAGISPAATVPDKQEKGAIVRWWERLVERFTKEKEEAEKAMTPLTGGRVKPPEEEKEEAREPIIKPSLTVTRQRTITSIQRDLDDEPRIMEQIEGLTRKKSVDGTIDYYYGEPDAIPMKLEDLDQSMLSRLLSRVRQEKAAIRREELQRRKEALEEELPAEEMEEEEIVEEEEPERPEREEILLTKEQMITSIKRRLKVFSEIEFIIPALSSRTDEEGRKEFFLMTPDGVPTRLEDLDKETLSELFARVNNEATRINTERLMRQIQQQEQIRRSIPQQPPAAVQPPPQPPTPPPAPPKVYTPPQQPPSPPQPPQQPTQPGRR
ncbi:MAG: hypothetical protein GF409_00500 [Candidatus Omnitrophica bacterium]|nr:hypothetical protein [Candidatus Omnitrophota bacterium]